VDSELTPNEFLRAVRRDYDLQWRRAQGHAQRHPLRIKMDRLDELLEREFLPDELDQFLSDAIAGDNPELSLLSLDLEPRWRVARQAGGPC
jgi:hypothetical protein